VGGVLDLDRSCLEKASVSGAAEAVACWLELLLTLSKDHGQWIAGDWLVQKLK